MNIKSYTGSDRTKAFVKLNKEIDEYVPDGFKIERYSRL